jgi:hypothetical protein
VENSAAEQPPERSSENDEESGLDRGKGEDWEDRAMMRRVDWTSVQSTLLIRGKGEDWEDKARIRREADLKAETRTTEKMQKMQKEQMRDQENLREATRRRDKELREEEERRRQEQRLMGKYVR